MIVARLMALLLVAAAAIVAPARADTPEEVKRLALVIGQSDYNFDRRTDTPKTQSASEGFPEDLVNPAHDAADIAEALRRLHFDVTTLENVRRAKLMADIAAFGQKISEAGPRVVVVIYYSGHAMQVDGVSLLVPIQAQLPGDVDFSRMSAANTQDILAGETVPLQYILNQLDNPAVGANVIVLDSCRSNWWSSRVISTGRAVRGNGAPASLSRGGAEQHFDLTSTIVAYSTQPGNVAADSFGENQRNSPYTTALKRNIERPGITLAQLFNDVALEVETTTSAWTPPQRPWESKSPLQNICLAGCRNEEAEQQRLALLQAEQRAQQLEAALQEARRAPVAAVTPLFRQITEADIIALAKNPKREFLAPLTAAFNAELPRCGIDTPLRVAHFLAQAAHEADNFRTLQEYASGDAYEGRAALGNTEPGDGRRYKGRGIFQLTGRKPYREYGNAIGVDLENNPELASVPETAVRIACEYWRRYNLNSVADRDDVAGVTRLINGGLNGLADRTLKVDIAKTLLGLTNLPPMEGGIVMASGLNLRSRPDASADILVVLPRGLKVTLVSPSDGVWTRVRAELHGQTFDGYTVSQYLSQPRP